MVGEVWFRGDGPPPEKIPNQVILADVVGEEVDAFTRRGDGMSTVFGPLRR